MDYNIFRIWGCLGTIKSMLNRTSQHTTIVLLREWMHHCADHFPGAISILCRNTFTMDNLVTTQRPIEDNTLGFYSKGGAGEPLCYSGIYWSVQAPDACHGWCNYILSIKQQYYTSFHKLLQDVSIITWTRNLGSELEHVDRTEYFQGLHCFSILTTRRKKLNTIIIHWQIQYLSDILESIWKKVYIGFPTCATVTTHA